MTKTESYYTTESHAYPTNTYCGDPATCTDPKHWSTNETEIATLAEARSEADDDDAQAVRIVKVTRTVTVEAVETISNPWTAEELADAV